MSFTFSSRRVAIVAALSSAFLLLNSQVAFADADSQSNGGYAHYDSSSDRMQIVDNHCDQHPVYVNYAFVRYTGTGAPATYARIDNNGGCGTSATYDLTRLVNDRPRIIFQHCTDDFPPDSCGPWVNTQA